MASSATRGARAASFSPRLRQSAAGVPEAIACQVTFWLPGPAPASSHFPMVSESGRTGSAPTVNGTAKSRRLPPALAGYSAVCPAPPATTSRSGAAPSRTATVSRHATRRRSSARAAGSEAPVTSGTRSGGCGQTAAAISIWSSRKGYLTCQYSLLRTAVPDGRGGGDPQGHARTKAARPGRATAPVLLVLVSVCLQVQLHEHRMHDGPPYLGLVAFLLTGACRADRNTCYPERRRPEPIFIGLAKIAAWTLRICGWRCTARAPRPDVRRSRASSPPNSAPRSGKSPRA